MIDGIVMNQGGAVAALGAEALRQHADDFIEFIAVEIAIGIGGAGEGEQFCFLPILGADGGNDLLGENIERIRVWEVRVHPPVRQPTKTDKLE